MSENKYKDLTVTICGEEIKGIKNVYYKTDSGEELPIMIQIPLDLYNQLFTFKEQILRNKCYTVYKEWGNIFNPKGGGYEEKFITNDEAVATFKKYINERDDNNEELLIQVGKLQQELKESLGIIAEKENLIQSIKKYIPRRVKKRLGIQ